MLWLGRGGGLGGFDTDDDPGRFADLLSYPIGFSQGGVVNYPVADCDLEFAFGSFHARSPCQSLCRLSTDSFLKV